MFLAWLCAGVLLHAGIASSAPISGDSIQLADVASMAIANWAEVAAAHERAEAHSQCPAIVGAFEDPMISPSIDPYPFEVPAEEGEMGEGGGGRRYDWSISVEQRFPLSGVRGYRRAGAVSPASA